MAAVLLDELTAEDAEDELRPVVDGDLGVGLAHRDMAGFGRVGAHKGELADDAGAVLVEPAVALVVGPVGRFDPELAPFGGRVGVSHEQVVVNRFEPPVEVLARVGAPVHEELLVAAVAHALLKLVDDDRRVEFGLAEAFVDGRVQGPVLGGADAVRLAFLDDGDLGACLRGRAGGSDARDACTDDEDVRVDDLGYLVIRDGLGSLEERRRLGVCRPGRFFG